MPPGKRNPFADEEDDDRRAEELASKLTGDTPEPDDDEELELSPGGDSEPESEEPEIEPAQARQSRSERRRARGEDLVRAERERREAAERREEDARRMVERLMQQGQQGRREPERPEPDPESRQAEEEAKSLRGQLQSTVERHAMLQRDGKLTPELDQKLQEDAWAIRDRMTQNDFKRFGPKPQQAQPQQTQEQMRQAAIQAQVATKHHDVVNDPVATQYFRAEWAKLLQRERRPDNWDTLDEAMERARRLAGLPPRGGVPAPSRGARAKYAGVSRGASGGDSGPKTVKMTRELKDMADAAYPHIKDDRKRYQHYVNKHGERLLKAGSR